MTQLRKYTWLIDTIQRAGKISLQEISEKWQENRDLNNGDPLHRATFNRWIAAIGEQFGITISCQRVGGYLYYIENPEAIEEDKLKKWMLDSFSVGNIIGENLTLNDRIIVDPIPSGRLHLTTMLRAMREQRQVIITYHKFEGAKRATFPIKPYCIKLFENRWYVLAHNDLNDDLRIYGLDRIENATITDRSFILPDDFCAADYFADYFGIVVHQDVKPERIVIRADRNHKHYLNTLPLHHSQRLIEDCGEYADYELYLAPTYDFYMRLLHVGAMVEVIRPAHVRDTIRKWIKEMYEIYATD